MSADEFTLLIEARLSGQIDDARWQQHLADTTGLSVAMDLRTRLAQAEESARNWEATCREAYADAGSAEFAERTYGAALQQIKAVCEDNARASRPDLALKFILDVVMKTLHGEPSADPEAI